MRTLTIALMLAVSGPVDRFDFGQRAILDTCPHSVLCQAAPDPFADYYERHPKTPTDILVCEEGEAPGADCNCRGTAEDTCEIVPWTECTTDSDCEIKARSPYGFTPMTDGPRH